MASKLNLVPSEDAYDIMMERQAKKAKAGKVKKASTSAKPAGDIDLHENLPSGRNKKKRDAVLDAFGCSDDVLLDGMVHLSISADTCAQVHYKSCADKVEKLLLEGNEKRLDSTDGVSKAIERAAKYTFQHYQVMLYLKKRLGEMGIALKKASSERDALMDEIESSQQRWSEREEALMGELAYKVEEITALRSQMSVTRSEISAIKVTLEAREEQIQDIFFDTVILTRGKNYQEYAEGKASTWDTAKAIRQMDSVLRAREGLPDDGEGASSGGAAGAGDDDEGTNGSDEV